MKMEWVGNIPGRKMGINTRKLLRILGLMNKNTQFCHQQGELFWLKKPVWCREEMKPIKQKNSITSNRGNSCLLIQTVYS